MDPKRLWRQIINRNTKENNRIPLRDWNSYLKSLYELPNAMDTISIVPINTRNHLQIAWKASPIPIKLYVNVKEF